MKVTVEDSLTHQALTYFPESSFYHLHLNSFSRMRVDLAAQVHVYVGIQLSGVLSDSLLIVGSECKCCPSNGVGG